MSTINLIMPVTFFFVFFTTYTHKANWGENKNLFLSTTNLRRKSYSMVLFFSRCNHIILSFSNTHIFSLAINFLVLFFHHWTCVYLYVLALLLDWNVWKAFYFPNIKRSNAYSLCLCVCVCAIFFFKFGT